MLFNDYFINQNKFNFNNEIKKEDISFCNNIEMILFITIQIIHPNIILLKIF